ncbi:MAG: ribonuclease H-like domain-containing protein, partial [Lachnospiraceae bacterium]|nr:ribonuclease H-like domain-containing protein [Lachnospiraceae bacterium]
MQIVKQNLNSFTIGYPLEQIAPLEQFLFVDIETTGFTAKSSSLYLIGTAFYTEGSWQIRQWFCENPIEEAALLSDFFAFAASFTHLIHFNGNNFDLPYLLQKCAQHKLPHNFDSFDGIDLYKRISPYKAFLHIPNCKQKTLETLLGIQRKDLYHGGELIEVYQNYVQAPSEEARALLLLHNRDDMRGMLQILPLLAFYDLFNGEIRAKKVQANQYVYYNGQDRQEVLM